MDINYDSLLSPLPSASPEEDNTTSSITVTIPSPTSPSSPIPPMPTMNPLEHPLNPSPPPAQYQSRRISSKIPTTTATAARPPHSSVQQQQRQQRQQHLRTTQVLYSCVRSPKHCSATFATRSQWVAHEQGAVHAHDTRPVLCEADAWYCGVQLTDELSSASSASSTPTSLSSSSLLETSSVTSSATSSATSSETSSPPPPQAPTPICTLRFPTPAHLADHLFSAHDIWLRHDDLEIDAHAVGARRGAFWCGFCAEMFVVGGSGGGEGDLHEAWEVQRFNHIEGHFLGVAGLKSVRGGGNGEWEGIFVV